MNTIKSLVLFVLISLTFVGVSISSVMALPFSEINKGDTVKYTHQTDGVDGIYGTTLGGEIFLDFTKTNKNADFISFCLEKNVTMTRYMNVSGIGDDYRNNRSVDVKSKYLAWNYFTGAFGEKSDTLANNVQNSVWFIEGDIVSFAEKFPQASKWYDEVFNNITENDLELFSSTYGNNVTALNLSFKGDNRDKFQSIYQSQLIVSSVTAPVPEPTTMALFGVGLLGFAYSVRQKQNKK